jgi:hypothetical protein
MLGFIALVAISSHLAPYLARREIFFGVTVSRTFREGPLARRVSRQYAVEIWLLAIAAGAFVVTAPMPFVSGGMLLGQTIGASVAFAKAWSAVHPHATVPTTIREAGIGPRDGLPGGILGQLGPFLILFAAAAYVALNWEDVPARFPTHWNLAGKADGWTGELSPGENTVTLNDSVNHARSGSNSCSASIAPWLISTSPLPTPTFCRSDDFHVLSRASRPSCNQLRKSSGAESQLRKANETSSLQHSFFPRTLKPCFFSDLGLDKPHWTIPN